MASINTLKTIENVKCRINPRYDLRFEDIDIIEKNSKGRFDKICKYFAFGYAQGVKAQKKGRAFND